MSSRKSKTPKQVVPPRVIHSCASCGAAFYEENKFKEHMKFHQESNMETNQPNMDVINPYVERTIPNMEIGNTNVGSQPMDLLHPYQEMGNPNMDSNNPNRKLILCQHPLCNTLCVDQESYQKHLFTHGSVNSPTDIASTSNFGMSVKSIPMQDRTSLKEHKRKHKRRDEPGSEKKRMGGIAIGSIIQNKVADRKRQRLGGASTDEERSTLDTLHQVICPRCNVNMLAPMTLCMAHIRSHGPSSLNPVVCMFKSNILSDHSKAKTLTFACTDCSATFVSYERLTVHAKNHVRLKSASQASRLNTEDVRSVGPKMLQYAMQDTDSNRGVRGQGSVVSHFQQPLLEAGNLRDAQSSSELQYSTKSNSSVTMQHPAALQSSTGLQNSTTSHSLTGLQYPVGSAQSLSAQRSCRLQQTSGSQSSTVLQDSIVLDQPIIEEDLDAIVEVKREIPSPEPSPKKAKSNEQPTREIHMPKMPSSRVYTCHDAPCAFRSYSAWEYRIHIDNIHPFPTFNSPTSSQIVLNVPDISKRSSEVGSVLEPVLPKPGGSSPPVEGSSESSSTSGEGSQQLLSTSGAGTSNTPPSGDILFRCNVCKTGYSDYDAFYKSHMRRMVDQSWKAVLSKGAKFASGSSHATVLACTHCNSRFHAYYLYMNHMQSHMTKVDQSSPSGAERPSQDQAPFQSNASSTELFGTTQTTGGKSYNQLRCSICRKRCFTMTDYHKHERLCRKELKLQEKLQRHDVPNRRKDASSAIVMEEKDIISKNLHSQPVMSDNKMSPSASYKHSCKPCTSAFYREDLYYKHMSSECHAKMSRIYFIQRKQELQRVIKPNQVPLFNVPHACKPCEIQFDQIDTYYDHMASEEHAKIYAKFYKSKWKRNITTVKEHLDFIHDTGRGVAQIINEPSSATDAQRLPAVSMSASTGVARVSSAINPAVPSHQSLQHVSSVSQLSRTVDTLRTTESSNQSSMIGKTSENRPEPSKEMEQEAGVVDMLDSIGTFRGFSSVPKAQSSKQSPQTPSKTNTDHTHSANVPVSSDKTNISVHSAGRDPRLSYVSRIQKEPVRPLRPFARFYTNIWLMVKSNPAVVMADVGKFVLEKWGDLEEERKMSLQKEYEKRLVIYEEEVKSYREYLEKYRPQRLHEGSSQIIQQASSNTSPGNAAEIGMGITGPSSSSSSRKVVSEQQRNVHNVHLATAVKAPSTSGTSLDETNQSSGSNDVVETTGRPLSADNAADSQVTSEKSVEETGRKSSVGLTFGKVLEKTVDVNFGNAEKVADMSGQVDHAIDSNKRLHSEPLSPTAMKKSTHLGVEAMEVSESTEENFKSKQSMTETSYHSQKASPQEEETVVTNKVLTSESRVDEAQWHSGGDKSQDLAGWAQSMSMEMAEKMTDIDSACDSDPTRVDKCHERLDGEAVVRDVSDSQVTSEKSVEESGNEDALKSPTSLVPGTAEVSREKVSDDSMETVNASGSEPSSLSNLKSAADVSRTGEGIQLRLVGKDATLGTSSATNAMSGGAISGRTESGSKCDENSMASANTPNLMSESTEPISDASEVAETVVSEAKKISEETVESMELADTIVSTAEYVNVTSDATKADGIELSPDIVGAKKDLADTRIPTLSIEEPTADTSGVKVGRKETEALDTGAAEKEPAGTEVADTTPPYDTRRAEEEMDVMNESMEGTALPTVRELVAGDIDHSIGDNETEQLDNRGAEKESMEVEGTALPTSSSGESITGTSVADVIRTGSEALVSSGVVKELGDTSETIAKVGITEDQLQDGATAESDDDVIQIEVAKPKSLAEVIDLTDDNDMDTGSPYTHVVNQWNAFKPPLMPSSPYKLFHKEVYLSVQHENDELRYDACKKIIKNMWRVLPKEEQQVYMKQYDEVVRDYNIQMEKYNDELRRRRRFTKRTPALPPVSMTMTALHNLVSYSTTRNHVADRQLAYPDVNKEERNKAPRSMSTSRADPHQQINVPVVTLPHRESRPTKPRGKRKKPLTPFFRYNKKIYRDIKKQHPCMEFGEIGKLIGQMWRELPEEEADVYKAEYLKEKYVYDKEEESLKQQEMARRRKMNKAFTAQSQISVHQIAQDNWSQYYACDRGPIVSESIARVGVQRTRTQEEEMYNSFRRFQAASSAGSQDIQILPSVSQVQSFHAVNTPSSSRITSQVDGSLKPSVFRSQTTSSDVLQKQSVNIVEEERRGTRVINFGDSTEDDAIGQLQKLFAVIGNVEPSPDVMFRGSESFKCQFCGLMLHSQVLYEDHTRNHSEEHSNTCVSCKRHFSNQTMLEQHKATCTHDTATKQSESIGTNEEQAPNDGDEERKQFIYMHHNQLHNSTQSGYLCIYCLKMVKVEDLETHEKGCGIEVDMSTKNVKGVKSKVIDGEKVNGIDGGSDESEGVACSQIDRKGDTCMKDDDEEEDEISRWEVTPGSTNTLFPVKFIGGKDDFTSTDQAQSTDEISQVGEWSDDVNPATKSLVHQSDVLSQEQESGIATSQLMDSNSISQVMDSNDSPSESAELLSRMQFASERKMSIKCEHCNNTYYSDSTSVLMEAISNCCKSEAQCPFCFAVFTFRKSSTLKMHLATCKGSNPENASKAGSINVCLLCDMCFATEHFLEAHVKTHSINDLMNRKVDDKARKECQIMQEICKYCKIRIFFVNRSTFVKHIENCARPTFCPCCKTEYHFKSVYEVKMHLATCAGVDKPGWRSRGERSAHSMRRREQDCRHCGAHFRERGDFESHVQSHSIEDLMERKDTCKYCHKMIKFTDRNDFIKHSYNCAKIMSQKEFSIHCPYCSSTYKFLTSFRVKVHLATCDGVERQGGRERSRTADTSLDELSDCHYCHQTIVNRNEFETHIESHTIEELMKRGDHRPNLVIPSKLIKDSNMSGIIAKSSATYTQGNDNHDPHTLDNHNNLTLHCPYCRCKYKFDVLKKLKMHLATCWGVDKPGTTPQEKIICVRCRHCHINYKTVKEFEVHVESLTVEELMPGEGGQDALSSTTATSHSTLPKQSGAARLEGNNINAMMSGVSIIRTDMEQQVKLDCPHCDLTMYFDRELGMKMHLATCIDPTTRNKMYSTSKEKSRNVCEYCNMNLKCRDRLEKHVARHDMKTLMNIFKCKECGQKFRFEKGFVSHKRVHAREWEIEERYRSDVNSSEGSSSVLSGASSAGVSSLQIAAVQGGVGSYGQQMTSHHSVFSEQTLICPHCDTSITYNPRTEPDLKLHLATCKVMNEDRRKKYYFYSEPYSICEICDEIFSSKEALASHVFLHSMNELLTCKICISCNQRFRHEEDLLKHRTAEHGFQSLVGSNMAMSDVVLSESKSNKAHHVSCSHCDMEIYYDSDTELRAHLATCINKNPELLQERSANKEDKSKYACQVCLANQVDQKYNTYREIEEHVERNHTMSSLLLVKTCKLCRSNFRTRSQLAEHQSKWGTRCKREMRKIMKSISKEVMEVGVGVITGRPRAKCAEQERSMKCPHCNLNVSYRLIEDLQYHLATCLRGVKEKPNVICQVCGDYHAEKLDMWGHAQSHLLNDLMTPRGITITLENRHEYVGKLKLNSIKDVTRSTMDEDESLDDEDQEDELPTSPNSPGGKNCRYCNAALLNMGRNTENPHKCRFCDTTIMSSIELRKHEKVHMTSHVCVKCPVCHCRHATQVRLNQHMLCHIKNYTEEQGELICHICDFRESVSDAETFVFHVISHQMEGGYWHGQDPYGQSGSRRDWQIETQPLGAAREVVDLTGIRIKTEKVDPDEKPADYHELVGEHDGACKEKNKQSGGNDASGTSYNSGQTVQNMALNSSGNSATVTDVDKSKCEVNLEGNRDAVMIPSKAAETLKKSQMSAPNKESSSVEVISESTNGNVAEALDSKLPEPSVSQSVKSLPNRVDALDVISMSAKSKVLQSNSVILEASKNKTLESMNSKTVESSSNKIVGSSSIMTVESPRIKLAAGSNVSTNLADINKKLHDLSTPKASACIKSNVSSDNKVGKSKSDACKSDHACDTKCSQNVTSADTGPDIETAMEVDADVSASTDAADVEDHCYSISPRHSMSMEATKCNVPNQQDTDGVESTGSPGKDEVFTKSACAKEVEIPVTESSSTDEVNMDVTESSSAVERQLHFRKDKDAEAGYLVQFFRKMAKMEGSTRDHSYAKAVSVVSYCLLSEQNKADEGIVDDDLLQGVNRIEKSGIAEGVGIHEEEAHEEESKSGNKEDIGSTRNSQIDITAKLQGQIDEAHEGKAGKNMNEKEGKEENKEDRRQVKETCNTTGPRDQTEKSEKESASTKEILNKDRSKSTQITEGGVTSGLSGQKDHVEKGKETSDRNEFKRKMDRASTVDVNDALRDQQEEEEKEKGQIDGRMVDTVNKRGVSDGLGAHREGEEDEKGINKEEKGTGDEKEEGSQNSNGMGRVGSERQSDEVEQPNKDPPVIGSILSDVIKIKEEPRSNDDGVCKGNEDNSSLVTRRHLQLDEGSKATDRSLPVVMHANSTGSHVSSVNRGVSHTQGMLDSPMQPVVKVSTTAVNQNQNKLVLSQPHPSSLVTIHDATPVCLFCTFQHDINEKCVNVKAQPMCPFCSKRHGVDKRCNVMVSYLNHYTGDLSKQGRPSGYMIKQPLQMQQSQGPPSPLLYPPTLPSTTESSSTEFIRNLTKQTPSLQPVTSVPPTPMSMSSNSTDFFHSGKKGLPSTPMMAESSVLQASASSVPSSVKAEVVCIEIDDNDDLDAVDVPKAKVKTKGHYRAVQQSVEEELTPKIDRIVEGSKWDPSVVYDDPQSDKELGDIRCPFCYEKHSRTLVCLQTMVYLATFGKFEPMKVGDGQRARFMCPICYDDFPWDYNCRAHTFSRHVKTLTNSDVSVSVKSGPIPVKVSDNTYACTRCQSTFHSHQGCRSHLTSCDGTTNGRKKSSMTPYKSDKPRYRCPFCPEVHTRPYNCRYHVQKQHTRCEKPKEPNEPVKLAHERYLCPFCSWEFPRESSCKKHIERRHLTEDQLVCGSCSKSYNRSEEHWCLALPIREKTGHYRCPYCPHKVFTRCYNCTSHIKEKHSGPDPNHVLAPRDRRESSPQFSPVEMQKLLRFDNTPYERAAVKGRQNVVKWQETAAQNYKCKMCGVTYHQGESHRCLQSKCPHCMKFFLLRSELMKHILSDHKLKWVDGEEEVVEQEAGSPKREMEELMAAADYYGKCDAEEEENNKMEVEERLSGSTVDASGEVMEVDVSHAIEDQAGPSDEVMMDGIDEEQKLPVIENVYSQSDSGSKDDGSYQDGTMGDDEGEEQDDDDILLEAQGEDSFLDDLTSSPDASEIPPSEDFNSQMDSNSIDTDSISNKPDSNPIKPDSIKVDPNKIVTIRLSEIAQMMEEIKESEPVIKKVEKELKEITDVLQELGERGDMPSVTSNSLKGQIGNVASEALKTAKDLLVMYRAERVDTGTEINNSRDVFFDDGKVERVSDRVDDKDDELDVDSSKIECESAEVKSAVNLKCVEDDKNCSLGWPDWNETNEKNGTPGGPNSNKTDDKNHTLGCTPDPNKTDDMNHTPDVHKMDDKNCTSGWPDWDETDDKNETPSWPSSNKTDDKNGTPGSNKTDDKKRTPDSKKKDTAIINNNVRDRMDTHIQATCGLRPFSIIMPTVKSEGSKHDKDTTSPSDDGRNSTIECEEVKGLGKPSSHVATGIENIASTSYDQSSSCSLGRSSHVRTPEDYDEKPEVVVEMKNSSLSSDACELSLPRPHTDVLQEHISLQMAEEDSIDESQSAVLASASQEIAEIINREIQDDDSEITAKYESAKRVIKLKRPRPDSCGGGGSPEVHIISETSEASTSGCHSNTRKLTDVELSKASLVKRRYGKTASLDFKGGVMVMRIEDEDVRHKVRMDKTDGSMKARVWCPESYCDDDIPNSPEKKKKKWTKTQETNSPERRKSFAKTLSSPAKKLRHNLWVPPVYETNLSTNETNKTSKSSGKTGENKTASESSDKTDENKKASESSDKAGENKEQVASTGGNAAEFDKSGIEVTKTSEQVDNGVHENIKQTPVEKSCAEFSRSNQEIETEAEKRVEPEQIVSETSNKDLYSPDGDGQVLHAAGEEDQSSHISKDKFNTECSEGDASNKYEPKSVTMVTTCGTDGDNIDKTECDSGQMHSCVKQKQSDLVRKNKVEESIPENEVIDLTLAAEEGNTSTGRYVKQWGKNTTFADLLKN